MCFVGDKGIMKERGKIAVLMTCHNRVETTLECLRRLMPQLSLSDKVFLVDDGSTDGTGARVRSAYPTVHVIDGDGSLYWAKGMRKAWDVAEEDGIYDFYLWLNDDVKLHDNAIEEIIRDMELASSPSCVVVGACEYGGCCTYSATDANDCRIVPNGNPQRAAGWLNGNVVLVPRVVSKRIGRISSDYSHARADYDYAERLKLVNIPFFVSSHYVGICPFDFRKKIQGKKLVERISWLWKPGYFNLRDLYLIRSRYHGHARAVLSCVRLMQILVCGSI